MYLYSAVGQGECLSQWTNSFHAEVSVLVMNSAGMNSVSLCQRQWRGQDEQPGGQPQSRYCCFKHKNAQQWSGVKTDLIPPIPSWVPGDQMSRILDPQGGSFVVSTSQNK